MSYNDEVLKPEVEEILGYNGEVSVAEEDDLLADDDTDEDDDDDELGLDDDDEEEAVLDIGNEDNNY